MFVLAVQTEIFDTGYCWIVHLSFLTSHNLLFFRFCKTSKKRTFSVFLSFFLVKSPKSQSLKLNISRTAWPILMILNALSYEINLFSRCSSPLRSLFSVRTNDDFTDNTPTRHGQEDAAAKLLKLIQSQFYLNGNFLVERRIFLTASTCLRSLFSVRTNDDFTDKYANKPNYHHFCRDFFRC